MCDMSLLPTLHYAGCIVLIDIVWTFILIATTAQAFLGACNTI